MQGPPPEPDDADPALTFIAPHVDADWYRARNPDVRAAGADPATHYWTSGWREGRDPNDWFQTGYYLRSNPDVAAAGLNPLWHYLAQGRREGRPARPPGALWRAALDCCVAPGARTVQRPADLPPALGAPQMGRLLAAACAGARGLVVSLSHDRYTKVTGGTQLLVADEQRKFNGDGAAYVHLSPVEPRLGLAPDGPAPLWLAVIVDGAERGIATVGAVARALAAVPQTLARLFVVHTLHGHRPEAVAALAAALRAPTAVFWVHDYGAACGSPRLLRNDIAFCNAPPPDSMACRICSYGPERAEHRRRVANLFAAVPFRVVAPSQPALDLWQRATGLPVRGANVHPHAHLEPLADPDAADDAAIDGPARVAFVGQAAFHKGWEVFADLVAATHRAGRYAFFQIASAGELRPPAGVTAVAAESSANRPFAMVHALAEQRIDLLLALSPWPETFGYVAHEALAAGADIVTLEGSGNIADLVRRRACGVVLEDAAALTDWFASGRAADHVRRQRAGLRRRASLVHDGSTATLALAPGREALTDDPDLHLRLDGARLDGVRDGDAWRFTLPAPTRPSGTAMLYLRSRHVRGAWDTTWGQERRRLGVAVAALAIDGAAVPLDDRRLGAGWNKPEPGWRWTLGDGLILAGAARSLDVTIVKLARYWRAPLL